MPALPQGGACWLRVAQWHGKSLTASDCHSWAEPLLAAVIVGRLCRLVGASGSAHRDMDPAGPKAMATLRASDR